MKTPREIALGRGRIICTSLDKIPMTPSRLERFWALRKQIGEYGSFDQTCLDYCSDQDLELFETEIVPIIRSAGDPDRYTEYLTLQFWKDLEEGDHEGRTKSLIVQDGTRGLKGVALEDFMKWPQDIMKSSGAVGISNLQELEWFLGYYPDIEIPKTISFKEISAVVMTSRPAWRGYKTLTDILRYAMYAVGSNPSLESIPKRVKEISWRRTGYILNPDWRNTKSFGRALRKDIMSRIEEFKDPRWDGKFYGAWLFLSERIHPGDYTKKYPKAAQFFHDLKNGVHMPTWESGLQRLYDLGTDPTDVAKYIATRPGELVRRFDSLIRRSDNKMAIMKIFLETPGMKPKTLVDLAEHFERRRKPITRIITLKSGARSYLPALDPLEDTVVDSILDIIRTSILDHVKRKGEECIEVDQVQRIGISEDTKMMRLPKDMRKTSLAMPRGIRYKVSGEIVRFFLGWEQLPGTCEDLDLHAYLWKSKREGLNIGFHTQLSEGTIANHSGDVIEKPGKCAEYVDIDVEQAAQEGYKWVVFEAHNYKGFGLNTLPCTCGYLEVSKVVGGDKDWNPWGVAEFMTTLVGSESSCAMAMFDITNREMQILDLPLSGIPVPQDSSQETAIIEFFSIPPSISIFDILEAYWKGRGYVVESGQQEGQVKYLDSETIATEWINTLTLLN